MRAVIEAKYFIVSREKEFRKARQRVLLRFKCRMLDDKASRDYIPKTLVSAT